MEHKRIVSVVVPTRDRPELLRNALASIRALEGPDLEFEILVGDNGNTPETKAIVAELGGLYLSVPRNGAAAARNAGLRAASGEFIAFLDDDDEWLPGNVRPHIAILDSEKTLDAVVGRVVTTDSTLKPNSEPWPQDVPAEQTALLKMMLSGYYPQVGATVIRRGLLDKVGFFDEDLLQDEDWDWHMRIAQHGPIGFVPITCIHFRQRPDGSYDDLKRLRVRYARKVFLRHAAGSARKLWNSPSEVWQAYYGAIWHHYDYFMNAAIERAERRDLKGFRAALYGAFGALPPRTVKDLMKNRRLQSAALSFFRRV